MSVSPQDVEKVALLARLTISESDLPEVTERFARVLDLVDELNTIDTQDVVPMSNPHDMEQRLRSDAVTRSNEREALMASAPVQEQGYFLVPKVID
ncbi:MAG: Asp-tRNA(Asn)/Glu-tRNA(Gln) amidotransferase subunit GatC [Luminiphilus sp.]|nr:Asp-tRNA(Asn)/Glu-tRNA(Gln) amidotransferase subunit GatC [Luminiphilus sp.]MDG2038394.1 Asp-tRNA(Asn)/Glu-tRNA(Gln) amidotransferase subunit GatC [Luminiphilus sp.]|tara:strand:+ start:284 stop:571 length:288 start_codon:yes stop_codon:yes gene_type:complete